MYHSVTIGGKNTWSDWHMVSNSRLTVNPPAVKLYTEDIPGADGALDLSEALLGRTAYGNRTGTWAFSFRPGSGWPSVYMSVLEHLHGQSCRIVLEDDPNWFYVGRVIVESWKSEPAKTVITLRYDLEPYKHSISGTSVQDWLWNDLFDNVIYYGTFDVDGTKARNLINPSGRNLTPDITCSAPMSVSFGSDTYTLPRGKSREITLAPGDNNIVFCGSGRVNVDYTLAKSL